MRRGVREAFANGKRRGDAFSPRDLRQERGTANALVLAEWWGGSASRPTERRGHTFAQPSAAQSMVTCCNKDRRCTRTPTPSHAHRQSGSPGKEKEARLPCHAQPADTFGMDGTFQKGAIETLQGRRYEFTHPTWFRPRNIDFLYGARFQ